MKIDAKKYIKSLKGEDIKELSVGDAIAEILTTSLVGGKAKAFSLAMKFINQKAVEVETADIAIIREAVEKTERYTNLVAGQLLILLDELLKQKETK